MSFLKSKWGIALMVALIVALSWYAYRVYNTQRINELLSFDMAAYLSTVSDSTHWEEYEPLSLEIPEQ